MKFIFIAFIAASLSAHAVTITGKVQIKKKNGEAVADASNVVVFLEGLKAEAKDIPAKSATILQKDKQFTPAVLPIMVGMEVDFPNEDVIMHNVFSLSKTKTFDLGLYKKGTKKTVKFEKSGLVKIYCNIHEKMVSYILILDNPYYTTTDKDGNFKIENVPKGKFKLAAWHRYSDVQNKDLEITDGKEVKLGFDLVKGDELSVDILEKEIDDLHHKNKWGQDYKSKY
jgi:plastocyanin